MLGQLFSNQLRRLSGAPGPNVFTSFTHDTCLQVGSKYSTLTVQTASEPLIFAQKLGKARFQ